MKNTCLLFFAFLILLLNPLLAQNDSLYQKDFADFANHKTTEFSLFEDSLNHNFLREIRKQWTQFEVFQGKQKPIQPKPNHPIIADTTHTPTHPHLMPKVELKPETDPKNNPDKSIRKNPIYIPKVENPSLPENKQPIVPVEIHKECCMIDFFGETIPLRYIKSDFQYNLNSLTNEEVANCWEKISQSYYTELIDSITTGLQKSPLNFELAAYFGLYLPEALDLPVNIMCDRAMLAQKSIKGRFDKNYAFYEEGLRKKLLHKQEITGRMNQALKEKQFEIY